MKSLLKMTFIGGAIVFALAGCDDKKTSETTNTPQTSAQSTNMANTQELTESYALGASFASYLKYNVENSHFVLNNKEVLNGFSDTLNDQSKYTEQEIQMVLQKMSDRLNKEQEEMMAKTRVDNIVAGDKFRAELAAQPNAQKTTSGIVYQIIRPGKGPHPKASDTVVVHYTGTLSDGKKFDSSYDRGEPTQFPLSGVIPGWTEGLQLIGVGGKIKLVLPPELAYGDQSPTPDIPAASTLVFDVELLGINPDKTSPVKTTKK